MCQSPYFRAMFIQRETRSIYVVPLVRIILLDMKVIIYSFGIWAAKYSLRVLADGSKGREIGGGAYSAPFEDQMDSCLRHIRSFNILIMPFKSIICQVNSYCQMQATILCSARVFFFKVYPARGCLQTRL